MKQFNPLLLTAMLMIIVSIFLLNVPVGVMQLKIQCFELILDLLIETNNPIERLIDKKNNQDIEQKQEIQTLKGKKYLRN